MRPGFQRLVLFLILLLCPFGELLSADNPSSFINGLGEEIRAFIRVGDMKTANSIFASRFDMDVFGKRCLVDHWSELSNDERERYKLLLERNIKKRMNEKMMFKDGDSDFKFVMKRSSKEGSVLKTENELNIRGQSVTIGVYLIKLNGVYLVADYDFDGVLLSRQYRGQFNNMFRRYGKIGFFAKLENKLTGGS